MEAKRKTRAGLVNWEDTVGYSTTKRGQVYLTHSIGTGNNPLVIVRTGTGLVRVMKKTTFRELAPRRPEGG